MIVDKYGDYLVMQTLSQGMERLSRVVVDALGDLLRPRGILARNDPRARELEGLDRRVTVESGEIPELVSVREGENEYEVALDSYGNMFTADNDDDGSQGCRTLWCMEGGNHGYFSADGSRYWSADKRPGQSILDAHWHQDDPGVVPDGTINGAGGPTGVTVNEGELLGAQFEGAIFDADAGRNCVYVHKPVAKGGLEMSRPIASAILAVVIVVLILILPQRPGRHPGQAEALA